MNRLVTFSRSLLGLDDRPEEEHSSHHDARRLRWKVGVGAALVAGLGVIALAIAGSIVNSVGTTVEIPHDLRATSTASPLGSGVAAGSAKGSGSDGGSLVHVVGAVRAPGIYRLTNQARVIDAVMAAGGFTETAQLCAVNMAREVIDGEQLTIPVGNPDDCSASSSISVTGAGKKISLNRATVAELDTISGIGPTLAQRIVDWRGTHGSFTALTQLNDIAGISDKLFASIKDQFTL